MPNVFFVRNEQTRALTIRNADANPHISQLLAVPAAASAAATAAAILQQGGGPRVRDERRHQPQPPRVTPALAASVRSRQSSARKIIHYRRHPWPSEIRW